MDCYWTYHTGRNSITGDTFEVPEVKALEDSYGNKIKAKPLDHINEYNKQLINYGESVELSYRLEDKPLPGATHFTTYIPKSWGACEFGKLTIPEQNDQGQSKFPGYRKSACKVFLENFHGFCRFSMEKGPN